MEIACLDLEGVLVPEIWIDFAERTGIEALKATTRDIPDYDVLMSQRLQILKDNGLIFQSQVSYLIPIFGTILGYIFLKELITIKVLVSLIAVCIGIYFVKKAK